MIKNLTNSTEQSCHCYSMMHQILHAKMFPYFDDALHLLYDSLKCVMTPVAMHILVTYTVVTLKKDCPGCALCITDVHIVIKVTTIFHGQ